MAGEIEVWEDDRIFYQSQAGVQINRKSLGSLYKPTDYAVHEWLTRKFSIADWQAYGVFVAASLILAVAWLANTCCSWRRGNQGCDKDRCWQI
jgi:hypothetical protein